MENKSPQTFATQFRLRDLVVLVFVAAVLMALIGPWIIPVREASRRNACQAKLRGLGLALINYESAFRAFPLAAPSCTSDAWHSTGIENGQDCVGPNWAVQVLGQMEELALRKTFDRQIYWKTFSAVEFNGVEPGAKVPSFMTCPSGEIARALHESTTTQLDHLAKGNYAACLGSSSYLHSIEGNELVDERLRAAIRTEEFRVINCSRGVCSVGMIPGWMMKPRIPRNYSGVGVWLYGNGKGTKLQDITDGTSRTVLLSEVLPYDTNKTISEDIRGAWISASMGASAYSHFTTPNSTTPDNINGCDATASGPLTCVEIAPGTDQEGNTFAAARSHHTRGVNVVFTDASSRFVTDDVDVTIWRSMATRAGGETEQRGQTAP